MIDIGNRQGGIALDTVDGNTVIAGYRVGDRYVAQEILIDSSNQDW